MDELNNEMNELDNEMNELDNEMNDNENNELDNEMNELDNEMNEFEDLTPTSKGMTTWFPWHGKWRSTRVFRGHIFWGSISVLLQKDAHGSYETSAMVSSKGLSKSKAIRVPIYVNPSGEKHLLIAGENDGQMVVFTARKGMSRKTKRPKLSGKYRSDNPYDLGRIKLRIDKDFWE